MKIRDGFVSNSSSSSFICRTTMPVKKVKEKLEIILKFYNDLYGTTIGFEDMFTEPYKGTKKYDAELKDWGYLNQYKVDGTTVGKIVIDSAYDNSIPYALFELIEDIFDGNRLHLG